VNRLEKIVGFCINSNIWVAISVVALVGVTYVNIAIPASSSLMFFMFFGTIFGYNFIKYFEKEQLSRFMHWVLKVDFLELTDKFKQLKKSAKRTLIISVVSLCCSFFCFFKLELLTQVLIVIPLFLTVFYAVSFGNKTLRNIAGVKIYVVGITWAITTVLLPVIEEGLILSADVWVVFLQRFLFVVALVLPFDIRDLEMDAKHLKTIPQKIGVKYTKLYGLFLLLGFFFLEFFKDELLEKNLIVMPLVFIITLLFIVLSTKRQSTFYSSFFVEGIPVLWLGLLMVL